MASEVGRARLRSGARACAKGRLQPGRIFFVDLEEGRIVEDEEIKARYIAKHPYREWVETHRALVDDLPRRRGSVRAATESGAALHCSSRCSGTPARISSS